MPNFAPLQNSRFMRALLREKVDRTPVWIMRQAGRYLPEYRATRAKAGSFMQLCTNPELACEVTLQPLARFDLDAAILFSDILTVPDAMGLGLHFVEGEGPRFHHRIESASDIAKLKPLDMAHDLRYVTEAVSLIRTELKGRVPLIGFAGSPWTLACYMIEGGGGSDFARAKSMLWDDAKSSHQLLDLLARNTTEYLQAQIDAGAQVVMVFDSWGGVLSHHHYQEFSLRYLKYIAANLKRSKMLNGIEEKIPLIFFSKGVHQLDVMADSGCDALGLDWTIDLGQARARVGQRVALQGNLDPACMAASPEAIKIEVARVLESFGHGSGHVFNLGHGITPLINPEHLGVLVDTVKALSPQYHQ